jgi:single-stranded DNA-binding protein
MPAPLPVTLTGTVSADTRFRDIPGGGGLAYFTLATEMTSSPAPGAPAVTRTVHIECTAARGTVADAMFDQLKRGTRVTVQGRPILTPPAASGPRLRQLNTLLVEPLPQA